MTTSKPTGGSVFLVEDEVMIRMMVADMLEELGHTVAAEAGRIDEALGILQSTQFDLAIIDVNLAGHSIYPVAQAVKALKRPFILATGYGALPDELQGNPSLSKPFQIEQLAEMIERVAIEIGSHPVPGCTKRE